MATRMLVAWCPDWPVTAAGVPPTEPAAVLEAGRVVSCSAAARAEGVRRGHRRRQAEACCPGLTVLASDLGRDARAFEPVVAALEAFTPTVEILRPGVAAFATRGPSRYFGGDAALAASVAAALAASVAAALAARVAATCVQKTVPEAVSCTNAQVGRASGAQVGIADGRFAAELAARQSLVVPPGGSAAFLAPFPVSTLNGGDADVPDVPDLPDLLTRLGVRTLGELAALPAKAVLARFGTPGQTAHRLAQGRDERPLSARTPPPDLDAVAELDPPAEQAETAMFVARALAARLHESLAARGLALAAVRIDAETEHGESRSRLWRLQETGAGQGAAALAERARWQLDGWLTSADRPTGPITLLRLAPEEIRPDGGRQAGFWGGDRAAAERVARALERVQGRLGPDAVAAAVVTGGRGPADQARIVPWGSAPEARPKVRPDDARAAEPWPGRLPSPAPATVLVPPLPAQVVDAAGATVQVSGRGVPTAPPAQLTVEGRRPAPIVAWAGPWPVDERWWDPHDHHRCARWQVVTAEGDAYLLSLENGRWLVEAAYD